MTKTELVKRIAEKTGHGQSAVSKILDAFKATVQEELTQNNSIAWVGFGVFKTVNRAERKARNPRTGELITIPAKTVPVFKFSKKFLD